MYLASQLILFKQYYKKKAYGFKFWLISLRPESMVSWNQQFIWGRGFEDMPISPELRACVHATLSMSGNVACLS